MHNLSLTKIAEFPNINSKSYSLVLKVTSSGSLDPHQFVRSLPYLVRSFFLNQQYGQLYFQHLTQNTIIESGIHPEFSLLEPVQGHESQFLCQKHFRSALPIAQYRIQLYLDYAHEKDAESNDEMVDIEILDVAQALRVKIRQSQLYAQIEWGMRRAYVSG